MAVQFAAGTALTGGARLASLRGALSLLDKVAKGIGAFQTLFGIVTDVERGVNEALVDINKFDKLLDSLRKATKETGDFKTIYDELFKSANRTGSALESNVDFFLRVAKATEKLGRNNSQILQLTEVVQQLGALGDTSPEQAALGIRELAKAMADGVINAREFARIETNLPEVAARIAAGFKRAGTTFQDALAAGNIGSGEAIDAVLGQRTEIVAAFGELVTDLEFAQRRFDQVKKNIKTRERASIEDVIGGTSFLARRANFKADIEPDLGVFKTLEVLQSKAATAARLHAEALGSLGTSAAEAQTVIRNLTSNELTAKAKEINAAIQANQEILDNGGGSIDSAVSNRVGLLRFKQTNHFLGTVTEFPEKLKNALEQIETLRKASKEGGNDSIALANGIIEIAEQHTALEPLAEKLRNIVETLTMAGENLELEQQVRTLVEVASNPGSILVDVTSPAEQGVGDIGGRPDAAESVGATTGETIAAAEASKKCLEELAAAANQAREALNGTDVAVKEATGGQEDLAGATDKTVAATEDACAAVEANRKCLEELAAATDQAGAATEKAGAATERLAQSSAGLGPGLERENKQLAVRVKAGPGVAQALKKELEARDLVARLIERVVASLAPEEIQQLNDLIALRGQTVEQLDAEAEARRDVAQAVGEQAEAVADAGIATGGGGFGLPFVADPEGIADQFGRPFEIVAGDIQQEFAGLFDRLFTDGIGAFADMGHNIKGIFSRLASNVARSLILQPQVLGVSGLG